MRSDAHRALAEQAAADLAGRLAAIGPPAAPVCVKSLLADPEWSSKADNWIAKVCRVDNHTVARIRAELSPVQLGNSQVEPAGTIDNSHSDDNALASADATVEAAPEPPHAEGLPAPRPDRSRRRPRDAGGGGG